MRRLLAVILATSISAAAPVTAQGEANTRRAGLWLTAGGGEARNRVDCDNCGEIERYWGGTGFLRAGGTLSDRVRVGGETYSWQRSFESSASYVRGLQGIILWYPAFPARGFFVQSGLGLARLRSEFERNGSRVQAAATGMSVMLGLGYEVRLRGRIWVTPMVSSTAVPTATIDTPNGTLENVVGTLLQFGLGVTWD